jgi:shikimate kinase
MNLILFGFKGCGKTYFGKKLSILLKRPFIDTDDLILKAYHEKTQQTTSIAALYRTLGEKEFRLLEKKEIDSLSFLQNSIIALGGGSILDLENEEKLKKIGKLVYLEASYETIETRKLSSALGPLKPLYELRKPLYERISAERLCLDLLSEEEILMHLSSFALQKEPYYGQ